MAIFIELDRAIYDDSGLVPLKRGDDWSLVGKIKSKKGSYKSDLDLSDVNSASAYFPQDSATGGTVVASVTIDDPMCGSFTVPVPKEVTTTIQETPSGSKFYMVLYRDLTEETVETFDSPLDIRDRGFSDT